MLGVVGLFLIGFITSSHILHHCQLFYLFVLPELKARHHKVVDVFVQRTSLVARKQFRLSKVMQARTEEARALHFSEPSNTGCIGVIGLEPDPTECHRPLMDVSIP